MKKLLILMLGATMLASCCASNSDVVYAITLPDGTTEYARGHYFSRSDGTIEFQDGSIYKNFVSIKRTNERRY